MTLYEFLMRGRCPHLRRPRHRHANGRRFCAACCRRWWPPILIGQSKITGQFLYQMECGTMTRTPGALLAEDDEPRRCPECGAVCDLRVQVCECLPECPLPPIAR